MDETNVVKDVSVKAQYHLYCSKNKKPMSLKKFARGLIEDGDTSAVVWFDNKRGVLEHKAKAARLKNKGSQLVEIRMSVRAARSKNSNKGAGNKPTK